MSDKFLFLYDKLMTAAERKKIKLNAEFIACGQMHGKMRWVVTRRISNKNAYKNTRRIFAIPKDTTKVIYGGIFLVKEWEFERQKVHAYYHNSIPNCGHTLREDLYDFAEVGVRPIKFQQLKDLKTGRYKIGEELICGAFVGNLANGRMNYNNINEPYYSEKRIDKENFITMITEVKHELGRY